MEKSKASRQLMLIMNEWSDACVRWFDNWKTWNEIMVPSFPTEKLQKFRKKFGIGFVEYDAMCLEIMRRMKELTDLSPRRNEPLLIDRLESIVDFYETVLPTLAPLQLEVWNLIVAENVGLFDMRALSSSSRHAKRVNEAVNLASNNEPSLLNARYVCWADHGCWLPRQSLLMSEILKTFFKETQEEPDLGLNERLQSLFNRFSRVSTAFLQRRRDLENRIAAGSSSSSS